MAYVPVPKDLNAVKTKVLLNLTKRQLVCFSAGAALGVPLATLLRIVEPLCRSGKLQAVDLVEFNPLFDIDGQGARTAARVAWQIAHWWR